MHIICTQQRAGPRYDNTNTCSFKVVLRPKLTKKIILFFFGFQNYVKTKHQLTQVLSSDFKKTPVYFNWNFLIYWAAITNFKILRELGRGENDVKDSLV